MRPKAEQAIGSEAMRARGIIQPSASWAIDSEPIWARGIIVKYPTTIFYMDVDPLQKYSPPMLHLSPATRIFNEKPCISELIYIGCK